MKKSILAMVVLMTLSSGCTSSPKKNAENCQSKSAEFCAASEKVTARTPSGGKLNSYDKD